MYSGYSIGALTAALSAKWLLADHGWRAVVWLGALPILTIPAFIILLPESVEFLVLRGKAEKAAKVAQRMGIAVPAPVVRDHAPGLGSVLRVIFSAQKALETICFWLALFMGLLLVYGLAQWLPQIMRKSGYDLGDSLLFLAVFSFSSAIGGIVLGSWADRFGVKKTIALSYLVGAFGIALLALGGPLLVNYLLVANAGFGTVFASLILTGYLAQRLDPSIRSAGTGFALSFSRLGALTGPLVGGYIASINAEPRWNFYIFAGIALIASMITALIPKGANDRA